MGEPVPELTKGSYAATQQVFRYVWYGKQNPILQAIAWAESKSLPNTDEDEVIRALIHFAEQLETVIDRLPANMQTRREKQLHLIQQSQLHLQAELVAATKQYREAEAEMRQMKMRIAGLRGQRNKIRNQLDQETALIADVETKGLRITVEAQPGYEAEVSRRQRQAIHEAIDEALGCDPSVSDRAG